MNSSSSLEFSLNVTGSLASEKLGITTTVKEQVQNIEMVLDTFKRAVNQQQKAQSELQLQLKKLDQKTHKDFKQMLQETTVQAAQLTQVFKHQNDKQGKEFQYLEMQAKILTQQHSKMNEVGRQIGSKTTSIENKVGV